MTTDTEFMTIKEAAEKFGKAEITIRRFVRNVVKENDQWERSQISPAPSAVEKLKKQSKPFSYKIGSELLEKHYAEDESEKHTRSSKKSKASNKSDDYVILLERTNDSLNAQLKVKDDQIGALNQSLDELTERQREANILMKGMQERFLLSSGIHPELKRKWYFLWLK